MYNLVSKWLDEVLYSIKGIDFSAFCFQLFEEDECKWIMELVWVIDCNIEDEKLGRDIVGKLEKNKSVFQWEKVSERKEVLVEMTKIVEEYLTHGRYADILKNTESIAILFTPEDMKIL